MTFYENKPVILNIDTADLNFFTYETFDFMYQGLKSKIYYEYDDYFNLGLENAYATAYPDIYIQIHMPIYILIYIQIHLV